MYRVYVRTLVRWFTNEIKILLREFQPCTLHAFFYSLYPLIFCGMIVNNDAKLGFALLIPNSYSK